MSEFRDVRGIYELVFVYIVGSGLEYLLVNVLEVGCCRVFVLLVCAVYFYRGFFVELALGVEVVVLGSGIGFGFRSRFGGFEFGFRFF